MNWAELAGCGQAHPPPETGRWGQPEPEGGNQERAARARRGQSQPQRGIIYQTASGLLANQDFLGFWMVDIHQAGRSQRSAPQRRHRAHLRRCAHCTPKKLSTWDGGGGKSQLAKHLVTWAAWTRGGHKTQGQSSLRLCGVPENLNLSSFDLGSALNPGPASDSSWQSNLEPEQCRLGKHTCR